jgi:poly-gamma-glutamate synthesis protein (capsule biosynthesis protein)
MTTLRLLIGGDLCPLNGFEPLFLQGEAAAILGPLEARARQADLFVANLECPLIEAPSPILKTGPVLGAPAACARGLQAMGLHAVGLANNHSLDHGAAGLASTLRACAGAGVATFGAGETLAEAQRPLILDVKGLRVGLLAMAEREWSLATPTSPGANPLDVMQFVRQMRSLRRQVDLVVVLVHGGAEGYQLPSPALRDTCRFLVEEGAHLVTCQHSHCVGTYEVYRNQLIVYGQGNFIFDYAAHGQRGQEGLLIALEVQSSGATAFELIPFTQSPAGAGLVAMPPAAEAAFREALEARSRAMAQEGHVEASWEAYCQTRVLSLMDEVLGHGRLLRRLNRDGALLRWRGKAYHRNLLSIFQNQSMVETMNTLLKNLIR